jgi:Mor family transcriptional regulator
MPRKIRKLTPEQQQEIIRKYTLGMKRKALSRKYKISYAKLSTILQRAIRQETKEKI